MTFQVNPAFVIDRTPKHWGRYTSNERLQLANKCGAKNCFLLPKQLKYPICNLPKQGRACQISCSGVEAARRRTILTKNTALKPIATKLSKDLLCTKKSRKEATVAVPKTLTIVEIKSMFDYNSFKVAVKKASNLPKEVRENIKARGIENLVKKLHGLRTLDNKPVTIKKGRITFYL